MAEKTVDAYIAGLDDWRAEVVAAVRVSVRAAAPEAKESIKWARTVALNLVKWDPTKGG